MKNDSTPALVHIVEDHDGTRASLARLLRAFGYDVAEYASALEFQRRPRSTRPECAVVDVRLPGLTGLELQRALADSSETTPLVFLTAHGDIPMSVQAMKLGAVDFLTKPADQGALLQAIGRAVARSTSERERQARLQELRARYDTLTGREREVFAHVVAGKLNKQIAFDLGTAERTIKAHRHQVMDKMRAGSLADLVGMAHVLQLIQPGG